MAKNSSKTPFLVAGLALAGLAGYLYFKSPQKVIEMGSNYGYGGSSDFYGQPIVNGVDSTVAGIEDTLTTANIGSVDVNDSADKNMFDVISRLSTEQQTVDNVGDEPLLTSSDITELAAYGGLAGSGYAANRILKSTAVKTAASGSGLSSKAARGGLRVAGGVSRAVPIVGGVLLVADVMDMFVGKAGDGGYTGEQYDPSNTVIDDLIAQQMADAKTVNVANAVTPSADVKNNVGNLMSTENSLNYIAGTPGDTWKRTYYAEKTGASASKGSTTSTYQSSSGAQVALAGISPSEYESYLKSKGK